MPDMRARMTQEQEEIRLNRINQECQKSYRFDHQHPSDRIADHWFQNPPVGLTLFVVFYTLACRWSRCLGCNLPSLSSPVHIPFSSLNHQIDQIFTRVLTPEQKRALRKIILSNNGSILDEATFSTTSLLYFVAMMNAHCPGIAELTIESRPEYVDLAELEVLSRALAEGQTPTQLEIAIGFEAFDDQIRNEHFHKGMNLEAFESLVKKLALYRFHLKTYFMQKPVPGMSEEDAVDDIHQAIDYLDRLAREYGIPINLHLNPTYVARGTALETAFLEGSYTPPQLDSVRRAVLRAEGRHLSVFIGLSDEGLAVPGGSFIRDEDQGLIERMEKFNQNQDFSLLK